jgi:hypothetical protein
MVIIKWFKFKNKIYYVWSELEYKIVSVSIISSNKKFNPRYKFFNPKYVFMCKEKVWNDSFEAVGKDLLIKDIMVWYRMIVEKRKYCSKFDFNILTKIINDAC